MPSSPSSKTRLLPSQVIGGIPGLIGEHEIYDAREPHPIEKPLPQVQILGSISFEKPIKEAAQVLGGAALDTLEETFGLGKYILGVEPELIATTTQTPSKSEQPVTPKETQHLENTEAYQYSQYWVGKIHELDRMLSQEERENLLKQAIRLLEGPITDQDIQDQGLNTSMGKNHLENTGSIHSIANTRIWRKIEAEEEASKNNPALNPNPTKKPDNSMRLDEQEGASMVSSGGAAAGRVG